MNLNISLASLLAQSTASQGESQGSNSILIVMIAMGVFLLVGLGMALGVMFGRRPISGSCGGIGKVTDEKGETSCALCQNPGEACKELQKRMEQPEQSR
ncbi:MAG: (Na+)-NQR maturation NqrM [Pirellulaceae bacterium]